MFANDVLSVTARNPTIGFALNRAILLIEECARLGQVANIHAVTGPENITQAILISMMDSVTRGSAPIELFLFEREKYVRSRILAYKRDDRYWVNAQRKEVKAKF